MASTFDEKQLNFLTSVYQKTILTACSTVSTSGDNTIIAAPGAGLSIYITSIMIQLESTTATTALLKEGSSTIKKRVAMDVSRTEGLMMVYPVGFQLKIAANTAVALNLSGSNAVGYSIDYYIE